MLKGLDIHWNGKDASKWRARMRHVNSAGSRKAQRILDGEGLIFAPHNASTFQQAALPFAVFHHMPTPKQKDNPVEIDTSEVIDFHQALSSLNSYPALLRALGLVFDFDLPAGFVASTTPSEYGTLSVAGTSIDWKVPTQTPELETAYVNLPVGQNRLFLTAPLIFEESSAPYLALGLIGLDPNNFGLAQVDVDGAMHKTIILADTLNDPDPDHNYYSDATPEPAPNPEIYDRDATLPSLRSGGFSLFADQKGVVLLENMSQSKTFNDAMESGGAQKPIAHVLNCSV